MKPSFESPPIPKQGEKIIFKFAGHQQDLCKDLFSMWHKTQLCDLTFKLSDGEIKTHSSLMAAFSPTIADILSRVDSHFHKKGEMSQKYITVDVLSRFSLQVMSAIVGLLYTGQFQMTVSTPAVMKHFLEASRWLKIERLVSLFEKWVEHQGHSADGYLSNSDPRRFVNVAVLSSNGSTIFAMRSNIMGSKENNETVIFESSSSSSSSTQTTHNASSSSSSSIHRPLTHLSSSNQIKSSAQTEKPPLKDSNSNPVTNSLLIMNNNARDSSNSNLEAQRLSSFNSSLNGVSSISSHPMPMKKDSVPPQSPVRSLSSSQRHFITRSTADHCRPGTITTKYSREQINRLVNKISKGKIVSPATTSNTHHDNRRVPLKAPTPTVPSKSSSGTIINADCNHTNTNETVRAQTIPSKTFSRLTAEKRLKVELPTSGTPHIDRNAVTCSQQKSKLSEIQTQNHCSKNRNKVLSHVNTSASTSSANAKGQGLGDTLLDLDVPEIKMEVDDLSDFMSSCDELNSLNVANLVEVGGIDGHIMPLAREPYDNDESVAGRTVSDIDIDGTSVDIDIKDEIKEEINDDNIDEEMNMASFLSNYIDENYSLNHDHVYFVAHEHPNENLVNVNQRGGDGDKNKKKRKTPAMSRVDEDTRRSVSAGGSSSNDSTATTTTRLLTKAPCTETRVAEMDFKDMNGATATETYSECEPGHHVDVSRHDNDIGTTVMTSSQSVYWKKKKKKIETHTSDEELTASFWCNICSAPFTKEIYLLEHTSNHPVFSCTHCPAKFYRSIILQQHVQSLHDFSKVDADTFQKHCQQLMRITASVRSKLSTFEFKLKCPECSYIAKSAAALCRHSDKEHGQPKPFTCDYDGCNFRAPKPSNISQHVRTTHAVGKKFTCEKCGAKCKNATTLKSHRMSCLKLVELLCNFCGKTFYRPQNLVLHMETIHGRVKKFKCKQCFRRFSSQGNLSRHMRVHNKAFPYPCCQCGKKFRHSNTLKSHLETMH